MIGDRLHARANAEGDEEVDDAIAADERAEGVPEREIAARAYARTVDMAESATDDADAPPRRDRATKLDTDPVLGAADETELDERS